RTRGIVLAEDRHPPAVRPERADDRLDGGGLASAVRTEEPEALTRADLERDAVQRGNRAVGMVEILDLDGGRGHGAGVCPRRLRGPTVKIGVPAGPRRDVGFPPCAFAR